MSSSLEMQMQSLIFESAGRLNFWANSLSTIEFVTVFIAEIFIFINIIILVMITGLPKKIAKSTIVSLMLKSTNYTLYIILCSLLISIYILITNTSISSVWEIKIALFDSIYCITLSTQIIKSIIILMFLFIGLFVSNITETSEPMLLIILILLSLILISITNFVVLLIVLEGFSLILYIMTTLNHSYGGITASVKYFIFGTLGSIFLFWGVVHLYLISKTLSFSSIEFFHNNLSILLTNDSSTFEFATTLLLIGFLIKLGAAPTHQWVSDVYSGSSLLTTMIFAIFTKVILFIVFIKTIMLSISSIVLDTFIIISLIIGCYFTLKQTELKRFIAYSSIFHVAFLLMGDLTASVVYIVTYVLSNLLFFSVVLDVKLNNKEIIYMSDLKYLRQKSYYYTLLITLALVSAAGLPPLAGFYGKFSVWVSLMEDIYLFNNLWTYIILLVSILTSLISIFYYIRVVAYLFVGSDEQLEAVNSVSPSNNFKQALLIQVFLALLILFWTFIHSTILQYISTLFILII